MHLLCPHCHNPIELADLASVPPAPTEVPADVAPLLWHGLPTVPPTPTEGLPSPRH